MLNSSNSSFNTEFEPSEFFLSQNYPNPFKEKTIIKYCVAYKTRVQIIVYDSDGKEIEKLVDEVKSPGTFEVEFSARQHHFGLSRDMDGVGRNLTALATEQVGVKQGLPNGYYFYRMIAGDYSSKKKWFCINNKYGRFNMKTLLQTLFFFLLIAQICFGQNGYVGRDISKVITEEKQITDSTILIKRIDHIAAYYNSIAEVDSMLSLFNGILGLPQWFSPAIRDVVSPPNSKFYNTGIYLGNVFLEFITFNIDTLNPPPPSYIPYFNAFAFSNEITNTAAILDSRGIPRSQVFNYLFREPDSTILLLFSNILLSNFNNNELLVFFCQYHPELFNCQSFDFGDLPAITNPDSQHIYFGNLVDSINGGPLTLSKVQNIVLTSNNFESYRQKLNTLFFPTGEYEPGKWSPPAGPSLILDSGQTAIKLTTINIVVDSLQTAKEFLISQGLGFQQGENYLKLDLSANVGVDIILTDIVTTIEDQINHIPDDFVLFQNYPNPFNPSTKIKYSVPQTSIVQIKVFDILGNEIETLVNEEKQTGTYELTWNAANLPSGVYFYQLRAGDYMNTKKMILLK